MCLLYYYHSSKQIFKPAYLLFFFFTPNIEHLLFFLFNQLLCFCNSLFYLSLTTCDYCVYIPLTFVHFVQSIYVYILYFCTVVFRLMAISLTFVAMLIFLDCCVCPSSYDNYIVVSVPSLNIIVLMTTVHSLFSFY